MLPKFEIRQVSSKDVLDLRHSILRPNQTRQDCVYPNDDDSSTLHFATVLKEEIISIATFFSEKHPDHFTEKNQWRLL